MDSETMRMYSELSNEMRERVDDFISQMALLEQLEAIVARDGERQKEPSLI